MAIYTIIALILASFWALGHFYQKKTSEISINQRRTKLKINNLKNKIDAIKKEKSLWEKKIKELQKEIEKIKKEIDEIEENERLLES